MDFTATLATLSTIESDQQNVETGLTNDLATAQQNLAATQAVIAQIQAASQLIENLTAQVTGLGGTPVTE